MFRFTRTRAQDLGHSADSVECLYQNCPAKKPQHNDSFEFTCAHAHSLSASSYLEDLLEPMPAVICQEAEYPLDGSSEKLRTWKRPKPSYCEEKNSNYNAAVQLSVKPVKYTDVPIQKQTFRICVCLSPNALHLPICHLHSNAVCLQIRSTAVPFDQILGRQRQSCCSWWGCLCGLLPPGTWQG